MAQIHDTLHDVKARIEQEQQVDRQSREIFLAEALAVLRPDVEAARPGVAAIEREAPEILGLLAEIETDLARRGKGFPPGFLNSAAEIRKMLLGGAQSPSVAAEVRAALIAVEQIRPQDLLDAQGRPDLGKRHRFISQTRPALQRHDGVLSSCKRQLGSIATTLKAWLEASAPAPVMTVASPPRPAGLSVLSEFDPRGMRSVGPRPPEM